MAQFNENIELLNASGITVQLKNEQAEIAAGGSGTPGVLRLYNAGDDNANPALANVVINGSEASISAGGQGLNGGIAVLSDAGNERIALNGNTAGIAAGGNGSTGDITLVSDADTNRVRLLGSANLWMGGNGADGDIVLFRNDGDNETLDMATVRLDGQSGNLVLGSGGSQGDLFLKNESGEIRTALKGDANLWMGGNGADGDIMLFRTDGDNESADNATVHLDGESGNLNLGGSGAQGDIFLRSDTGEIRTALKGDANLWMGGHGADGDIMLFKSSGSNEDTEKATVHLDGESGNLSLGGNSTQGDLFLKSDSGKIRVALKGDANLWMGGHGADGDIMLFPNAGTNDDSNKANVHLDGENGDITLRGGRSQTRVRLKGDGNLWLGGNGGDGDIAIFRTNGDNQTLEQASIHLDGGAGDLRLGCSGVSGDITLKGDNNQNRVRINGAGNLWLGGNGGDGDIVLFNTNGDNQTLENGTVHLDGEVGDLRLGCNGVSGDITLKGNNNQNRVRLKGDGNLWLGGNGSDGDIMIFKTDGDNSTIDNASIHMNGDSGNIRCNDVIIPGADFAEDFDIHYSIADTLEPGTVMVLGRDGKLLESSQAFDRKVAGVVSGAGKYKVGITLDKQPGSKNRMPIALSGKVMVKIDASYGSIEVGDLITTSPRKGYAMKADDPYKAFGAVIGKALADFPEGDGFLPILVALQ